MTEKGKIHKFGNCNCIDAHHKDIILGAIASNMRTLSNNITEIKSDSRKMKMYGSLLDSYISASSMLEETRSQLKEVPDCPI